MIRIFMLFTLIFGDNFFYFIILANCAIDESCTEKLAPISPKGPKFVVQAVFLCTACIDEEFATNGIQPNEKLPSNEHAKS